MSKLLTKPLVTSVIAGIFLGLSFSPFNLVFLSILGFALLIQLVDQGTSFRQVMYYTFPGLLMWNIISSYWLIFATVSGGLAAILANAIIMTIPLGFSHYIRKYVGNTFISALLSASAWVVYEFLHYRWDLAWPWLTAGNSFVNTPMLIQYISITGVLGLSFWIVTSGSLLFDWVRLFRSNAITSNASVLRQPTSIAFLMVFFIPQLISITMYFGTDIKPDSHVEVVVVQPNYDSYADDHGYDDIHQALVDIIALTDSVITPNTKFVFWPENALIPAVHGFTMRYPANILQESVNRWHTTLITGATWYRYYQEDEPAYFPRQSADGTRFNIFNAALSYSPDRQYRAYEKANLVPIVERLPFYAALRLIPGVDWERNMGYGKGTEIVNFSSDDFEAPALICYDSVFPNWVRSSVLEGADFIGIITNDGWWGNTSGHIQHYDFARLRAIENRRSVVRSANNGISGMIHANGDIHSKTEYWTRTSLRLNVPVYSQITFYTRFGDWIGYLGMFFLTLFMGSVIARRFNTGHPHQA